MKTERPTIVCLCGSTRFIDAFRAANLRETIAGKIVLSIGCDTKSDTDLIALGELTEEAKAALDELHKRKIDLADEVLILNVGGYVGKSTLSEIIYADRLKKPLRWLEPMQCPCCKGRGGFDSAEDSHECALCHGACGVGNDQAQAEDQVRRLLPAAPCSAFEMVDATDDEQYFTLGVWLTLEAAIAALDECKDPDDLGSDGYHDDYAKVEIRKRAIGWSGHGKKVYQREWSQKYDEAKDEYEWHVVTPNESSSATASAAVVERKGYYGKH